MTVPWNIFSSSMCCTTIAFTNGMKRYCCYTTVHCSYVITKLDVSRLCNGWTYIVQVQGYWFFFFEKQISIRIHKQHKYKINILQKTKSQQITTSGNQKLKWDHVLTDKNTYNSCWSKTMYWRTKTDARPCMTLICFK